MKVYLRGKKKLKYLTYPQPDVKASNYEDWISEDSIVMRWLWNLTLLLLLNFVILQRRFGTLLQNLFPIKAMLLRCMKFMRNFSLLCNLGNHYTSTTVLLNLWEQLLQWPLTTNLEQQK